MIRGGPEIGASLVRLYTLDAEVARIDVSDACNRLAQEIIVDRGQS